MALREKICLSAFDILRHMYKNEQIGEGWKNLLSSFMDGPLLCPLYCIGAYREFVRPSIRLLIQSKNVNKFKSANFLFNIEAVSECDMYAEHN